MLFTKCESYGERSPSLLINVPPAVPLSVIINGAVASTVHIIPRAHINSEDIMKGFDCRDVLSILNIFLLVPYKYRISCTVRKITAFGMYSGIIWCLDKVNNWASHVIFFAIHDSTYVLPIDPL